MELTTRHTFNRRLHFLMSEYANMMGKDKEDIKDEVREYLVSRSFIKESISEAGLKGLAVGCLLMERKIGNIIGVKI
tara:strand:+ start:242 stop:472 length:231 start_codon:yes stop_codon:yes gene_type:complete